MPISGTENTFLAAHSILQFRESTANATTINIAIISEKLDNYQIEPSGLVPFPKCRPTPTAKTRLLSHCYFDRLSNSTKDPPPRPSFGASRCLSSSAAAATFGPSEALETDDLAYPREYYYDARDPDRAANAFMARAKQRQDGGAYRALVTRNDESRDVIRSQIVPAPAARNDVYAIRTFIWVTKDEDGKPNNKDDGKINKIEDVWELDNPSVDIADMLPVGLEISRASPRIHIKTGMVENKEWARKVAPAVQFVPPRAETLEGTKGMTTTATDERDTLTNPLEEHGPPQSLFEVMSGRGWNPASLKRWIAR
ncbi:hypothetical protein ACJ41O_010870 [Fusarium nematophilum]